METREQRGLKIAATVKLQQKNGVWMVPSQTNRNTYAVHMHGSDATCTCPDHEERRVKCKHIFAVEFSIQRESNPDGTTTITRTLRVTYAQDWPAYNAAQVQEKTQAAELLRGLCDGVVQPPQGRGRPRLPLSDVIFSAVMKVFVTTSGRRASSDLRDCATKGHIQKAPHYNSIFHYLEDKSLTPILKAMVEESAAPLKAIEYDFAVDSSGFSTCTYVRWFDEKYGRVRSSAEWVKVHLMTGVRTNVVTSVEVTGPDVNDCPKLVPLLEATTKRFSPCEVSADKGYISKQNLEAITKTGATPYIPFKSNATGEGPELWRKMWHFYEFNRTEFLAKYHKRSNVESTFSMMKRKFGSAIRSKTPTAQVNEVLCKVICHNLCVLVKSMHELGIAPTFWAESPVAQENKADGHF